MKLKWFHVVATICTCLGLRRKILNRSQDAEYLTRYYLFNTRFLEKIFPRLSYNIVLHHTHQSDGDGLHDHPWSWKSKLLSGGYWEETPEGRFWREPGQPWRSRKANDFHRLVLDPEKSKSETWSLFIMGPREKEWGFLDRDGQWVQWQEYINNRQHYI